MKKLLVILSVLVLAACNSCAWGALCNSTGAYWSISNIQVTADSIIN
jgi:hypothetical protein